VPALRFEIQAVCPETGARAGLLHTPHGVIETPVFMPVGTQGTVKGLTQHALADEIGARILLANTYHLYLRPGHETIARMGGLHRFMGWGGAILTDSGGYQVFSLNGLTRLSEEGVQFQSHLNGDRHLFTSESAVEVQLALGSDIAMVLDECLSYPAEEAAARRSMELTVRWAERAFRHFKVKPRDMAVEQALFPIVQGSTYAHLRRECAGRLVELEAEGYAIGGLSVGEPRPSSLEMAEVSAAALPREKPRYAMGVGMPDELAQYVACGVDMMDCVLPSRNARNGCLFTSEGKLIIKHARYKEDPAPPDPACSCYTCRHFSRAYLRHLYQAREILYAVLATHHNIHRYLDIMRGIRQAIWSGRFAQLLQVSCSTPAAEA
jgi:queuine tRNA-ribosyltransferase